MAEESIASDEHQQTQESKKHTKQQRVLIVVGIVSLLVVYVMMKRSQAANAGNANQAAAQQSALAAYEAQMASQYPYGAGYSGANASSDPYALQIMNELQTLQNEITAMSTPTATSGSAPQPANPALGAPTAAPNGFYGPPSGTLQEIAGGHTYEALTNPSQLGAIYGQLPTMVQPAPGVFVPYVPGTSYPGGTTVFAQTG